MKFSKSMLTLGAAVAVGSLAAVATPSAAHAKSAMSHAAPCAGMKSGKMQKGKKGAMKSSGMCAGKKHMGGMQGSK